MTVAAPKDVSLSEDEEAIVEESLGKIREVFKKRNVDIANVIGLVTTDEVKHTGKQVEIRFAEETAARMNMVAFD
jgi:hypothetical protein